MTKTDHLARAKDYIARGEDYYRKAAQEMGAAKQEDGLSNRAIGAALGKSESWVANLLRWHQDHDPDGTPFSNEVKRERRRVSAVKKVARENPKALADAITAAPAKAQRKIADELVRSSSTERSLRAAVAPPKRKPREQKAIEQRLSAATFSLWEIGEALLDEVPAPEQRLRMLATAEKAQQLAAGIVYLLDTGKLEDEFRSLVEEVGANS